jgi:hypothetical protein
MPLIYGDLIGGRRPAEVQALLDTIHEAVLEAFTVPQRDRYQVVNTHPSHKIVSLSVSSARLPRSGRGTS